MKAAPLVRGLIAAVLCLNVFVLGAFLVFACKNDMARVIDQSPTMFQDFTRYYSFGRIAASNQPGRLYDRQFQLSVEEAVLGQYLHRPLPQAYTYGIDYTPPVALFMAPFSLLPYPLALLVCQTLSIAAGVIGLHKLRARGWRDSLVLLGGLAASIFSWRALAIGQLSWLIVGLVAGYFHCLLSKRYKSAGVLLALLAVPKLQYAVYLAIPLLVSGRRVALATAGAVTALLVVASGLAFGWSTVFSYPSLMLNTQASDPGTLSMACLRSLTDLVLHRPASTAAAAAIFLAGLVSCAIVWKLVQDGTAKAKDWAVAATVCLSISTNFHAHNFDTLLLAVAAARTLPTLDIFDASRISDTALRRWTQACLWLPVLSWLILKIPDSQETARCVLVVLACAALAVWCTRQFLQSLTQPALDIRD